MTVTHVNVPDVGAADVDVIEVLVKIGDTVDVETPLITLESDKATMEVPSPSKGVVKEIKVKAGDKVSEGSEILLLEAEKSNEKEMVGPSSSAEVAAKLDEATAEASKEQSSKEETTKEESSEEESSKKSTKEPSGGSPEESSKQSSQETSKESSIAASSDEQQQEAGTSASHKGEVHAGPLVRKLAREFGVDLMQVSPTGPKQRILKEDIQSFVKTKLATTAGNTVSALPSAPSIDFEKFGPVDKQPLSRINKMSGKNLHRNWLLVPHITQFGEADITELEAFRVTQKQTFEKQGVKLTPLVFIMKAVAGALTAYPQFNASLDPSGDALILKKYIHIGVAVDTPEGLVVPVIRDVNKKGLFDLAKELSVVSEKARKKQLSPLDMQGGCFSISSLGGIGGTAFTPIVNLPEVAILGVSKSSYKPIYQDKQFVPRLMLPLSLSYDHRVIDGADGARFITYLSEMLSDIRKLLL